MSKKKKKQPRDQEWDIANATTQDFKPFVDEPKSPAGPTEKQEPKRDEKD